MANWKYLLYKDFEEGHFKGQRLFVTDSTVAGIQFWGVDGAYPMDADRTISFLEEYKDLKVARVTPPAAYYDGYWTEQLKRQGIIQ